VGEKSEWFSESLGKLMPVIYTGFPESEEMGGEGESLINRRLESSQSGNYCTLSRKLLIF